LPEFEIRIKQSSAARVVVSVNSFKPAEAVATFEITPKEVLTTENDGAVAPVVVRKNITDIV
jgi:hypothetical protein